MLRRSGAFFSTQAMIDAMIRFEKALRPRWEKL
jgi:hypothetical protein